MRNASGRLRGIGLALWFCGLGALGLVRFGLQARDGGIDLIAWLWLIGATVSLAIGLGLLRHARRPGRASTRD